MQQKGKGQNSRTQIKVRKWVNFLFCLIGSTLGHATTGHLHKLTIIFMGYVVGLALAKVMTLHGKG